MIIRFNSSEIFLIPLQEVIICAAFVPPPVPHVGHKTEDQDVHVHLQQGLASFCYKESKSKFVRLSGSHDPCGNYSVVRK